MCTFYPPFVVFLNDFHFPQAVLNGYWVVFEDIDKAPSDVQSILVPLLEGVSSFITGHGEVTSSFLLSLVCT